MALTVGLPIYLRLARWTAGVTAQKLQRGAPDTDATRQRLGEATDVRPDGPLVWIHVASDGEALAIIELVSRIHDERDDIEILMTISGAVTQGMVERRGSADLFLQRAPADHPQFVSAFLDHWKPDLAIFTEDELRPALLAEVNARQIPRILIDARMAETRQNRWRWMPGVSASLLQGFQHILAADPASARRLRQMGAPPERMEEIGGLEEGTVALPCNEYQRDQMARLMAARPAWLAAFATTDEIDELLTAHSGAMRKSHRLLLILVPDDPAAMPELTQRLEAGKWAFGLRSNGDDPDPETQVLIADLPDELGLWYRLAPVTFMANSLVPGSAGRNPFEPAALGSAVIHGPHVSAYRSSYSKLQRAGAARLVSNSETICLALEDLMAPDRAAAMAHAAWMVGSAGAEVTDRVREIIFDILDEAGL